MVAFAVTGSLAGWLGDAVWSLWTGGVVVFVSACTAIFVRVARLAPAAEGNVVLSFIKAAAFGLLAWLFSLLAWLGLEIGIGGRFSSPIEATVGVILGGLVGCGVYWLAHKQPTRRVELLRRVLLGVAALVAVSSVSLFFLLTGPRDLERYPPAANSLCRLPRTGGVTRLCIQGNRAIVSHRGWEEFAYDFAMPVGSDVCAARGGIVVEIDVEHDGNGFHAENNYVTVDHGDGTFGCYLHLRHGGTYVKLGQHVRQGELIGASGNVGMSMLPHLHFHVITVEHTLIPVTFADVESDGGIPRMFKRYTSGNYAK